MKRRTSRSSIPRFVLCLSNEGNVASLDVFKVYRVVAPHKNDEPQDLRIIDESGEDYLYPRENFLLLKLPAKAMAKAVALQ